MWAGTVATNQTSALSLQLKSSQQNVEGTKDSFHKVKKKNLSLLLIMSQHNRHVNYPHVSLTYLQ